MDPESPEREIGQGYKYLAAGLRFGGGIVMFLLVGLWVDGKLHSGPLFLLLGTALGATLGFVSIWREIKADKANRPTWHERHGKKE